MTAILVAPEREKKAYRMRCAFTVPSGTRGRSLELATLEAGKRFIRDMSLRGYHWRSDYKYTIEGPFPHIELREYQSKAQQSKTIEPEKVTALVQTYPTLGQTQDEDYRLTMTFVLPERIIQTKEDVCR